MVLNLCKLLNCLELAQMTEETGHLDKIGSAGPTNWSKYATANITTKTLKNHLNGTIHYEHKATNIIKFFENLRTGQESKQLGIG